MHGSAFLVSGLVRLCGYLVILDIEPLKPKSLDENKKAQTQPWRPWAFIQRSTEFFEESKKRHLYELMKLCHMTWCPQVAFGLFPFAFGQLVGSKCQSHHMLHFAFFFFLYQQIKVTCSFNFHHFHPHCNNTFLNSVRAYVFYRIGEK